MYGNLSQPFEAFQEHPSGVAIRSVGPLYMTINKTIYKTIFLYNHYSLLFTTTTTTTSYTIYKTIYVIKNLGRCKGSGVIYITIFLLMV